ncbi:hypothetical protein B0T25DRAFT_105551 [Lasiosphaeria hispida]|uniref:Uncharacterized protein n=1 Tax=Lasiosphaeria hispida TaxID=260671 RepID=A0AAJ0HR70_9PEZI|nr:hypothetical protein B0T25DRAFT_105551 [Lasiosphaeria hispida]
MFRYALRRASPCRLRILETVAAPSQRHAWPASGSFRSLGSKSSVTPTRNLRTQERRPVPGLPSTNETIYALSSGTGRGGIAVIRISGPGCLDIYNGLCPTKPPPKPRYTAIRTLIEPGRLHDVNIVDSDALVLYFPGLKTVTGEDVLELHVHGGSATVKAVLDAIPKSPSQETIRYAEPGEFTKRAFLNDRLDLAQVESLGDTLAAETEQQRRAAVRGNSGILGRTYESWRAQLLEARGEIEALIDFSEDQHFDESPAELLANVTNMAKTMLHSIQLHKAGSQRNELLRNGIRIALLGPPNVGKSSLMNQIIGREASIVSAEAGTTRDIVEANLDIRGYLCSFADTAGIRTEDSASTSNLGLSESSVIGGIEQEGIRRAREKALNSDVIIVLAAIEQSKCGNHRIHYDIETLHLAAGAQQCLIVINKSDVVSPETLARLTQDFKTSVLGGIPGLGSAEPLSISCRVAELSAVGLTDPGRIQTLTEELTQSFSALTSLPNDMQHLHGVTERQGQLLDQCQEHLEDFMAEAQLCGPEGEADIVLAAEHLRLAANRLARITGRGDCGDVEDVLGVIFEKFCVGK